MGEAAEVDEACLVYIEVAAMVLWRVVQATIDSRDACMLLWFCLGGLAAVLNGDFAGLIVGKTRGTGVASLK